MPSIKERINQLNQKEQQKILNTEEKKKKAEEEKIRLDKEAEKKALERINYFEELFNKIKVPSAILHEAIAIIAEPVLKIDHHFGVVDWEERYFYVDSHERSDFNTEHYNNHVSLSTATWQVGQQYVKLGAGVAGFENDYKGNIPKYYLFFTQGIESTLIENLGEWYLKHRPDENGGVVNFYKGERNLFDYLFNQTRLKQKTYNELLEESRGVTSKILLNLAKEQVLHLK